MNSILNNSLAKSSSTLYNRHWASFHKFMATKIKAPALPAASHHVALYTVHLHKLGLLPTTIRSYLSAIAFTHKIHGHDDPTTSFRIKKLLDAYKRLTPHTRQRLPIGEEILHKVVSTIRTSASSGYDKYLWSSVFLVMYHACLRVSEVTSSKRCNHNLKLKNLCLQGDSLIITMRSFKHSKGKVHSIRIDANHASFCPVVAVRKYLKKRGGRKGPFFLNSRGRALTRKNVVQELNRGLKALNINHKPYNTHSLRIGKLTDMAMNGASWAQLRAAGRFHSNAFQKYVKPMLVNIPT